MPTSSLEQLAAPVKKRNQQVCMGCSVQICNVCSVCHTLDCKYAELRVISSADQMLYRYLDAQTQKAKGFVRLAKNLQLDTPTPYHLVIGEEDIEDTAKSIHLRMKGSTAFVRPCPVRARHGFEESRPVKVDTLDKLVSDIKEIWTAAQAADEEHKAELLILPYIDAKYNAIITPGRIAVGPNHDGATAGYDSISVPLMGVPFKEIHDNPNILKMCGIGPDEDPYIEVVYPKSASSYNPLFTQIRAGVKIDSNIGADYVPTPVRVKEVIDASGDLLEWEKQVKAIKPGTVVVKLGGTLISHYGVHCLYNKVPCFTSRRPAIGEVLDKLGVAPDPDPAAVKFGLGVGVGIPLLLDGAGFSSDEVNVQNALITMMTTLHNAGVMTGEHAFWIGFGAGIMMRMGMAASHGEARHKLQDLQGLRNFVYKLAIKDFVGSRNTIGTAQWMFQNLSWSGSYGGRAWANCTESVINMDHAAQELFKTNSVDAVRQLVTAYNSAVNQAHNGGWWLNKFTQQMYFNQASEQSLRTIAIAAATMYQIKKKYPSVDAVQNILAEWAAAKPIAVEPGGKLQMQLVNSKIDQTTFTDTVKQSQMAPGTMTFKQKALLLDFTALTKLREIVPSAKGGLLLPKAAVVCTKCLHWFKNLSTADVSEPTVCGHDNCPGLVGWWTGSGALYYTDYVVAAPVSDGLDHFDTEDDDVDDFLPEEIEPEPEPTSKPTVYHNINGTPVLGSVVGAQANVIITGHKVTVHLQYMTDHNNDGLNKYFSTNITDVPTSENAQQMIVLGPNPYKLSWSGSGIHYWPAEVSSQGDGQVVIIIPKLNIVLRLDMETNTLQQGGDTNGKEQEEVITLGDDIPF